MNDDVFKIRQSQWNLLTSDQKVERLKAQRNSQGSKLSEAFEREINSRGAARNAALANNPNLWSFVGYPGPDVDQKACLALLQCLESALDNPRIAASLDVYNFVLGIYSHVGSLDASQIGRPDKLEVAFAKVARGKSASISAKALRNKDGFDAFRELCLRWFSEPDIYAGKMDFYRDVIEKGWCKTEQTARNWFKKVRAESEPCQAWLVKFEA